MDLGTPRPIEPDMMPTGGAIMMQSFCPSEDP